LYISDNDEKTNYKKVLNNLSLLLGLDENKIEIFFSMFKDKTQDKQLMLLWNIISNNIKPDIDNKDNFKKFTEAFINIFNYNYQKFLKYSNNL